MTLLDDARVACFDLFDTLVRVDTSRLPSVRFDGDQAFVVTFKKTDPLYVIDLANPSQPRIAGELKIPGFSTYMHLLDETHQRLSFVMEEIFLHIDMATRRTAPWPADVAAALDKRIAEDAELPWEPDVSGSMSLR